jgi:hypothetical protein
MRLLRVRVKVPGGLSGYEVAIPLLTASSHAQNYSARRINLWSSSTRELGSKHDFGDNKCSYSATDAPGAIIRQASTATSSLPKDRAAFEFSDVVARRQELPKRVTCPFVTCPHFPEGGKCPSEGPGTAAVQLERS